MYQLMKGLKYLHDRLISHRGKFPWPDINTITEIGYARALHADLKVWSTTRGV